MTGISRSVGKWMLQKPRLMVPEVKRQTKTAAASVGEDPSSASPPSPTISTPPLPVCYPPFYRPAVPKAFPKAPVREEEDPWDQRISRLSNTDPRRGLPTVMGPPDLATATDVTSSSDQAVALEMARSIVNIIYSYTDDEGTMREHHFTGFVISSDQLVVGGNQTKKRFRILTSNETISESDPDRKFRVRLPNESVVEAKLLFFNEHYDITLLEISSESDLPLQLPSFGSSPSYGQEVFVLGRNKLSYLMSRRGTILWSEETDYLGRHCHLFFSAEISWYGRGGPVIDHDGNVLGMVLDTSKSKPPILAISTIRVCMEMWMKFSCIARPMHGLRLRSVEMLEVSLKEKLSIHHSIINCYIVDEVSTGSTAEKLGIKQGEVIISFDGIHNYTLPKLEEFLLSLGGSCLESADSSLNCLVYVQLEVRDLLASGTRKINLPIEFRVS